MECKIPLDKLSAVVVALIESYRKDSGKDEICISCDEKMYWNIEPKKMLVSDSEHPEIDVGDLADDWEFLEKMINSDYAAVSLMMWHVYPILAFMTRDIIVKGIVPRA